MLSANVYWYISLTKTKDNLKLVTAKLVNPLLWIPTWSLLSVCYKEVICYLPHHMHILLIIYMTRMSRTDCLPCTTWIIDYWLHTHTYTHTHTPHTHTHTHTRARTQCNSLIWSTCLQLLIRQPLAAWLHSCQVYYHTGRILWKWIKYVTFCVYTQLYLEYLETDQFTFTWLHLQHLTII